jgi:hypothetical protein
MTEKPIKSIVLDPRLETADVELENNYFPRRIMKSRFELYKESRRGAGGNPMRTANNRNQKDGKEKPVKSGKGGGKKAAGKQK